MNASSSSIRLAAVGVVVALGVAACGGSDGDEETEATVTDTAAVTEAEESSRATDAPDTAPDTSAPPATESVETAPSTEAVTAESPSTSEATSDAVDVGRVVVLGEESVLADLLALDVPVVASSATVPDAGFQGIEDDTEGIEIFDYLNTSLEELATLQPDQVIVWQYIVDQVGREQLDGLGAEVLVIPDGTTSRERVELFGEHFGREAEAEGLIADLDAAYAVGSEQVPEDCAASVVAIYPGPSPAVFARPVWAVPLAVDTLGCELVPSGDEIETDGNGRAYLSLEQLEVIAGPELILLQNDTVTGDTEAVEEIEQNPIWGQLPAVASGDVTVIDRLGYPGLVGETRVVDELVAIFNG
ncbi:ABC transporter substrate-binding protein [Ilumatobacter nonamiensis]|uniref:ABC transporter substrate-binding protein n=1 Tax=Ilumatobacter nonamiensis TaxID=467093 RepID=UPI00130E8869|nr:ABC transporter substrate-binding protein [Ilumatobacter nonamiensis]